MLEKRSARRPESMFGATAASLLSKALGRALHGRWRAVDSRLNRCLCAINWRYFPEVFKAVLAKGSSCKDRSDSGVGVEEDLPWRQKNRPSTEATCCH